jgi:hypothetical protein
MPAPKKKSRSSFQNRVLGELGHEGPPDLPGFGGQLICYSLVAGLVVFGRK